MPVKTVLNGGTVLVRIWTDDIDEGSKAQLANLPFIHNSSGTLSHRRPVPR